MRMSTKRKYTGETEINFGTENTKTELKIH